jgi:nucleotide-binding universal stress UspA family protein
MGEIVIGYDGSDAAKSALRQAAEFADGLGDKLVLVFGYAPHGPGGGEVPTEREAVKELGESVTREGAEIAKSLKVECEVELVPKHPVKALMDVADERDARMIAVGSHGEGPLKGAIVGSTPYKLVQLADRPVLVVRA